MRTPESPKWGTRSVERWIKKTAAEMKRGEVHRVTFEGVWRGGAVSYTHLTLPTM